MYMHHYTYLSIVSKHPYIMLSLMEKSYWCNNYCIWSKMDAGNIISQLEVEISDQETTELYERLSMCWWRIID